MEKKLRKKCEKLHKQNKFGEIITLLEGQPHDDYDAASQLARAYNNKGRLPGGRQPFGSGQQSGRRRSAVAFSLGLCL